MIANVAATVFAVTTYTAAVFMSAWWLRAAADRHSRQAVIRRDRDLEQVVGWGATLTPLPTRAGCERNSQVPADPDVRAEWERLMAETHVQRPCAGCRKPLIREPKESNDG